MKRKLSFQSAMRKLKRVEKLQGQKTTGLEPELQRIANKVKKEGIR